MASHDGPHLTDRPTVAELIEMLDSLVEWKKFGFFLPGITDPALKIIEKDYSSVDDQKMALFSKWLRVDPHATWYKVIEALTKAKENFLVNKLERKFLKNEPNSEDVFQKYFDKLSSLIGSEAILQRVINKFFARRLIIKEVYDDITTNPSYSAYVKGSKIVRELLRQIHISREQKQTLLKICDVLLSTDDQGLKDIATKIKCDLDEVSEVMQYSREDDIDSFVKQPLPREVSTDRTPVQPLSKDESISFEAMRISTDRTSRQPLSSDGSTRVSTDRISRQPLSSDELKSHGFTRESTDRIPRQPLFTDGSIRESTDRIPRQPLSSDEFKSHGFTRISTDGTSGQPLSVDESKSHEPMRVSTDGISIQSLSSAESQSHDPKRISTDGTSGQSLSSDEQASLHQVIDAMKITFDENDLIGEGSKGTFVYKGSFGSVTVAVKRVVSKQFNELVKREIEVLQKHAWHPNIVHFHFMEEDSGFINIALELCDCTLFEFVDGSKLQHANGKDLLLGAMKGVDHLHKFDIIHRDLKPQNILLKLIPPPSNEVIPLISDFGLCRELADGQTHMTTKYGMAGTLGWIAPEMSEDKSKVTRSVDIFAMGCIIYFVLSHGKHPFGRGECPFDPMSCQVKIKKKKDEKLTLSDLEGEDKCTAENLVRTMIKSNHELRPSSGEVLAHCLFWSKDKQLKFFQKASDYIKSAIKKPTPGSTIIDDLEKEAGSVFVNDWKNNIDDELKQDLEKTGNYDGTLVRHLLRAIRNKTHHDDELPKTFKAKVRSTEDLVSYFASQFPHLLIHTYNVMKMEPDFKERQPDLFKT